MSRKPVARWLSGLSWATACLLIPVWAQAPAQPGTGATALPNLGDGAEITLSAERSIGDRIARELYRDPDFIEDPVLDEYIQSLWRPLVVRALARGEMSPEMQERFAWKILLGKDRSVNAFALPGGYLGVHLGLISVVASRDELASVMAHELSHVTQRHIARSMNAQSRLTPLMIGSMILGVLAASKSPQSAQALIVGGQAAAIQSQLSFSRDMEREADRVGYGVMSEAGFDPQGFVSMFGKLQQASALNDNGSFPYLRSHPMTTERMADMQARQQLLPARPALRTPDLEHAMLSARARVLSQPGVDLLRSWTQEAAEPQLTGQPLTKQVNVLYGAVLAHMGLRDPAGAQRLVQRLVPLLQNNAPAWRLLQLLKAELAYQGGDMAGSLAALAALPAAQAVQRPELLARVQARARQSPSTGLNEDLSQLRNWVQEHPADGQAWQVLAAGLMTQGRTLQSLRAEGEAQWARMDYSGAIDRFKAAQDWARKQQALQGADHIEAAIVDARLRSVQSLWREQLLER
ncbi:MAG: M48 family metalloprotease [Rhodoferax sp.]